MKLKQDNELYTDYATSFLKWMRLHLEHSVKNQPGLSKAARVELVDSLVWSMSGLLDGTANVQHGDQPLVPMLGFRLGDAPEVVCDDGKVALHELLETEEED